MKDHDAQVEEFCKMITRTRSNYNSRIDCNYTITYFILSLAQQLSNSLIGSKHNDNYELLNMDLASDTGINM
jgi:hypothetical protein